MGPKYGFASRMWLFSKVGMVVFRGTNLYRTVLVWFHWSPVSRGVEGEFIVVDIKIRK